MWSNWNTIPLLPSKVWKNHAPPCSNCSERSFPQNAAAAADIAAHVYTKGNHKGQDQRRAHGDKSRVNEVLAYICGRYVHFFTQILAYAKCVPFYQIFKPILKHGISGIFLLDTKVTNFEEKRISACAASRRKQVNKVAATIITAAVC